MVADSGEFNVILSSRRLMCDSFTGGSGVNFVSHADILTFRQHIRRDAERRTLGRVLFLTGEHHMVGPRLQVQSS